MSNLKPGDPVGQMDSGLRAMSDGQVLLTRTARIISPEDRRLEVGERVRINGLNARVVAREHSGGAQTVVLKTTGGKVMRVREDDLIEHRAE